MDEGRDEKMRSADQGCKQVKVIFGGPTRNSQASRDSGSKRLSHGHRAVARSVPDIRILLDSIGPLPCRLAALVKN